MPLSHRLSSSRIELGMACLYWARLDVQVDDTSSAAARGGTRRHAYIERVVRGARAEHVLPAFDSDLPMLRTFERYWNAREYRHTEFRVALDVSTGKARILPGGEHHRDYSMCTPYEVPGTGDAIDADGWVYDWKTGRQAHITHARDNLQTKFVAACIGGVGNVVAHITPETVHETKNSLDVFDAIDIISTVTELVKRIPTAEPIAGPHCTKKYCTARKSCPAYRGKNG